MFVDDRTDERDWVVEGGGIAEGAGAQEVRST